MSLQLAVAVGILLALATGCVAVIAAWVIETIRTSSPSHYDRQDRHGPPQQHP